MSAVDKFFQLCKENDVEFVDFRFTDVFGRWHHVAYNFKAVEPSMFENGIPFDGSSIRMWKTIDVSDTLLIPDAETVFLDPFTADPTAVVICSVADIDGTPYEKDPRTIAKKALEYMEKEGIGDAAYFGPENEFFIFDHIHVKDEMHSQAYEIDSEEGAWNMSQDPRDAGGFNIGHRPQAKEGYFPVPPVDSQMDIRAEMVKVLEEVGIETFVVHHEVGTAGQGEIGVKFGTILSAADNVQKYKYVVKNVALEKQLPLCRSLSTATTETVCTLTCQSGKMVKTSSSKRVSMATLAKLQNTSSVVSLSTLQLLRHLPTHQLTLISA